VEDRDMIEIDVKLVPYGIKAAERTIAKMTIWNDATGTREVGNYKYKVETDEDVLHQGSYKNFERSKGILELVKNILNNI
jgi:hypothetical protein